MLGSSEPVFSLEFFPPKDEEGRRLLLDTVDRLGELEPSFVSVTYGAGGSTRQRTVELVSEIRSNTGITPMAHLTCVGASQSELLSVLDSLERVGIENVLALRGDPLKGSDTFVPVDNGLQHGSDLALLISENYGFCIGGACHPEGHPEAVDLETDVANTKLKIAAGASFLITQLFFENRAYFNFVDRARAIGISTPIIPGIMPITNLKQIERFSQQMGASIPAELHRQVVDCGDDPQAVLDLGVAWATLQCAELLSRGAPGIHFYTLNRSPATRAILAALKVSRPWIDAYSLSARDGPQIAVR
jgi:methylenetetrahydrofolate reductase (NADPH)